MKEYKILISIHAECEDDKDEVIQMFENQHPLEVEWWTEVKHD